MKRVLGLTKSRAPGALRRHHLVLHSLTSHTCRKLALLGFVFVGTGAPGLSAVVLSGFLLAAFCLLLNLFLKFWVCFVVLVHTVWELGTGQLATSLVNVPHSSICESTFNYSLLPGTASREKTSMASSLCRQ